WLADGVAVLIDRAGVTGLSQVKKALVGVGLGLAVRAAGRGRRRARSRHIAVPGGLAGLPAGTGPGSSPGDRRPAAPADGPASGDGAAFALADRVLAGGRVVAAGPLGQR